MTEIESLGEQLDRDIQLAQHEFLEETLTDKEEDDSETLDDDDDEFNEQLELAGEITLNTGSASSDDVVTEYLAKGCGCQKLSGGSCSQGLTPGDVSNYRLAVTELESSELDVAILAQILESYSLIQGAQLGLAFVSVLPSSMHSGDSRFVEKCSYFFTE